MADRVAAGRRISCRDLIDQLGAVDQRDLRRLPAPGAARRSRPMPCAAPVTTATLPVKRSGMVHQRHAAAGGLADGGDHAARCANFSK